MLFNKSFLSVVFFACAMICSAGPNKDTKVLVDYNALTEQIDNCTAGAEGKIIIAVRIKGAEGLDGFSFKILYDTLAYNFLGNSAVSSEESEKFFLESQGGKAGPMLVRAEKGSVELSSCLIGKNKNEAPDGDGELVELIFQRSGYGNCEMHLENIELIDSYLNLDRIKEILK